MLRTLYIAFCVALTACKALGQQFPCNNFVSTRLINWAAHRDYSYETDLEVVRHEIDPLSPGVIEARPGASIHFLNGASLIIDGRVALRCFGSKEHPITFHFYPDADGNYGGLVNRNTQSWAPQVSQTGTDSCSAYLPSYFVNCHFLREIEQEDELPPNEDVLVLYENWSVPHFLDSQLCKDRWVAAVCWD